MPLNFGFRIAQSPHYIGFHTGAVLTSISFSSSEEERYVTSDSYLSAGVTYFYRNNVWGFPVRVNASLPMFTLASHTTEFTNFTKFSMISNHFNPTVQIDFFEKKLKKGGIVRIFYQCQYLNTKRGVDVAFRQRQLQNLISVSFEGRIIGKK